MQAVVNQTISGLACGKPIRGNVMFLGGPLNYLDTLRNAFVKTLNLIKIYDILGGFVMKMNYKNLEKDMRKIVSKI